jgi:HAD superfamily hydrolase (TIGR01459 family)
MTLKTEDYGGINPIDTDATYGFATHRDGSATATKFRDGLSAAFKRYDTFLIDQWGVLHDGSRPYDGAVECLRRLTWGGKQVIIISNSGKRAAENESRLNKIGFPRDSYSHLVTSGEIAWQMLATGRGAFRKFVGKRCLLLSSDDPSGFADGLPISLAENVEEADFILLAGVDDKTPQQDYDHMIANGVRRGITLVCANPDLTRITPDGLKPGAGAMAQSYQNKGGRVIYIGKPHPEIYTHCLMLAATSSDARALAIGDSLHHDIAGGLAAGIDTLLVMGGVHAPVLSASSDPAILKDKIMSIAGPSGAMPDWATPYFRW